MSTVTLEIPEQFAKSFGATEQEAAHNARIELAIQMYREGKWSTGKAAEFSQMYLGDFMKLLQDRDVSRPYTTEMLEEDIQHAGGRV